MHTHAHTLTHTHTQALYYINIRTQLRCEKVEHKELYFIYSYKSRETQGIKTPLSLPFSIVHTLTGQLEEYRSQGGPVHTFIYT